MIVYYQGFEVNVEVYEVNVADNVVCWYADTASDLLNKLIEESETMTQAIDAKIRMEIEGVS